MPLKFPPNPGSVLRCDFKGLMPPEMIKPRPVVVISARLQRETRGTCVVVALSSTDPQNIHDFHCRIQLPGPRLPAGLAPECWVKGDMIYTVSLERLDLYRLSKDREGKRLYYYDRVDNHTLFCVRRAVGSAIGLRFPLRD
jgi:uncharacterized protein YifN (PemK superfamily)